MGKRVYVGNLSYDVDSSALEQMFAEFGTVQSAQVIMDLSPAEEKSLASIERHIGQRLPRVTLPGFDYTPAPPPRSDRAGQRQRGQRPSGSRPKGRTTSSPKKRTDGSGTPSSPSRPRRRR
jgi:hypothetical protein